MIIFQRYSPAKNFWCRWFGHSVTGYQGGYPYLTARPGPTDNIGREHLRLVGKCDRCDEEVQVGHIHRSTVERAFNENSDRYGQRRISNMLKDIEAHRAAVHAEGSQLVLDSWDRIEPHIDFVYEPFKRNLPKVA